MKLINLSGADLELKKDSLNESGVLPLVEVSSKVEFDVDFSVVVLDDHLKSKEVIKKFAGLGEIGVIIFDAHVDCLNSEDLVPFLSGFIDKGNIIIVGAREWNKDEWYFIKNHGIKVYSMKEIAFEGKEAVCDAVMAVAKDFGALYVSIDADVLDAETGGLSVRELLYFIQRLKRLKNFKAADLAEFKDIKVMAKIIRELA